jgi:iron complex outermembrane receptor protein
VLKGPQGTLFGRNTTGGAVLFVPQAPLDEFEGYVRSQLGTFSRRQLEAAVNLPLGEIGALRLAGFAFKREGYARTVAGRVDGPNTANAGGFILSPVGPKVILPSYDIYNQDVLEARATLRLTPFDGFENSTIVTWHGDKNRATNQLRQLRAGAPLAGAIGAFFPNLQLNNPRVADVSQDLRKPRSSTWAFINTTLFDINDNLRIKNILSHIRAKGWGNNPSDVDGSPFSAVDLERPDRFLKNRQTVEELQLQGDFGRVEFILGGLIDRTRQPDLERGGPAQLGRHQRSFHRGEQPSARNLGRTSRGPVPELQRLAGDDLHRLVQRAQEVPRMELQRHRRLPDQR